LQTCHRQERGSDSTTPGLTALITTLQEAGCCTRVYKDNSQALDHLLVIPAQVAVLVPGSYDVVHVNAEFADQAIDHDPQVARFLLPAA
jgi:uncharacterized protein